MRIREAHYLNIIYRFSRLGDGLIKLTCITIAG